MGSAGITQFLSHLAVQKESASTQNQAMSAIVRIISSLLQKIAAAARSDPMLTERTPDRQVMTSAQIEAAQELQSISATS
jgi:hypothetical protein